MRLLYLSILCGVLACGGGSSSPGPLMEHDAWVMTTDGEEFFGTAPPEAMCQSEDELGYRSEELGGVPVFSVSTEFCDWITVTQPSLRSVAAGDMVQLRFRHATLNTPSGAVTTAVVVIGDTIMWQEMFVIPQGNDFITFDWPAPKNFAQGTPLYFHVSNHGDNEYSLVNLDLL